MLPRHEGKLRAVFLNRFYRPDLAPTSQLLTDLAEDLVRYGWRVTVITGRGAYDDQAGDRPRREVLDGVQVIRVGTALSGRSGMARLAAYLGYYLGASWRLLTLRGYDVVVPMTDPPLTVGIAVLVAGIRKKRVAFWVQDVYPELAARLGVFQEGSWPYRLLRRLARQFYAACDAVIALGPVMARNLVEAGAPVSRTVCVDNWADSTQIRPIPMADNDFRRLHGLDDCFVILYSGNAGRAHRFEAVVEAARRLQDDSRIRFVFVGGGPRLPEVRRQVEAERLNNFVFLEYQPRHQLSRSLSAADISLVTEDPSVAGLVVPSKTYGILASGRPVVYVGPRESDIAELIRRHGCGVVIDAHDGGALAATIQALRDDDVLRNEMGARARAAAEIVYDRPIATRRWADAVEELVLRPNRTLMTDVSCGIPA